MFFGHIGEEGWISNSAKMEFSIGSSNETHVPVNSHSQPEKKNSKKPFSLYILSPVLHTVIAGSLLFPSGPHKEKQCRLFSF